MSKFTAIFYLVLAAVLWVLVLGTIVNMVLVAGLSSTVSVMNALVGQIFISACLAALATILFKKGRKGLSAINSAK